MNAVKSPILKRKEWQIHILTNDEIQLEKKGEESPLRQGSQTLGYTQSCPLGGRGGISFISLSAGAWLCLWKILFFFLNFHHPF